MIAALSAALAFNAAPLVHPALQPTPAAPLVRPTPTGPLASPTPRASTIRCALDVVDPSYNLALGSVALGAIFGVPGSPLKSKVGAFVAGVPLALFGIFIAFQTTTLRFTFDDDSFALVKSDLSSTGENVVVGGENDWAYKKFVNYDFFPSESFPILVYFKETATPQDKWAVGPGQFANSDDALAKGAVQGQVHFFPCIGNADQLRDEFIKNGCAKL